MKGFTIIEVVITIFLLSIAVLGVYNAFSTIVVLTANISDSFTAGYLAQEGMEIVRNIRDNNWIKPSPDWRCGLADTGSLSTPDCKNADYCATGCEADYKDDSLVSYSNNALYLDNDTGFYVRNPGSNTQTKFKRKITIEVLHIPDEPVLDYKVMKVIVEVFWPQKPDILNPTGSTGTVSAEEYLYNWY